MIAHVLWGVSAFLVGAVTTEILTRRDASPGVMVSVVLVAAFLMGCLRYFTL